MLAHKSLKVALASLVALALMAGVATFAVGRANAAPAGPTPQHAQDIVNTYLGILDGGMSGANGNICDFSALSTVYADDATLTLSGGPFASSGGPPPFVNLGALGTRGPGDELVIPGKNIEAFYSTFCGDFAVATHHSGLYPGWTQDSGYLLTPNVLDSYEHFDIYRAGEDQGLGGRCEHVFTIKGDRIESLEWSVYA